MTDSEPLSDVECREQALAGVRDALAGLQSVPAAGLDAEKHETVREMVEDTTNRLGSVSGRFSIRYVINFLSQPSMTTDHGGKDRQRMALGTVRAGF